MVDKNVDHIHTSMVYQLFFGGATTCRSTTIVSIGSSQVITSWDSLLLMLDRSIQGGVMSFGAMEFPKQKGWKIK